MLEIRLKAQYGDFSLEVDTSIDCDGVTALFGPTGSGKTSLLRSIAGLERHAGGRVVFDGETWQDDESFKPPHQRHIGYVFQEPGLFKHLDVLGNLKYGEHRNRHRSGGISSSEAIEVLGLEPLLKRDTTTLSGGERQRVAIGRAVASNPRMLLMDEPLSALDISSRHELLNWLESLQQSLKIPTVFVSHQLDEMSRLAEHMLLIEQGRVLAQGALNDVLTDTGLPLAQSPGASCVIDTKVQQLDRQWNMTGLKFTDQLLWVPGLHRSTGESVRVRISARDVSIALTRPEKSSILNVLAAKIDHLIPESSAQVLVKLDANGETLLARITSRSVNELGLKPGDPVFAQIKSIALLNPMDEQIIE